MSDIVSNPFLNKKVGVNGNQDNFISEIPKLITSVRDIAGSFKEKITPEEQQRKAGVWYNMLSTFVKNPKMNGNELAAQYEGLLPFKQRATKKRFMDNNIRGKSREYIINHLVKKINDELTKGGLPSLTKDEILFGMGVKKVGVTLQETMTGRTPIPTTPVSSIKLPLPDTKITSIDRRFDVVRPLRPTMEMALKTKGVMPSGNLEVLTNQFYNEIVRVDQPNNFTGQVELPSVNLYDCTRDNADEATDAIITAVVTYVKGLQERAAQGGSLSKVQEIIVRGTQSAESIIKEKAKEAAAQKFGTSILFEGKWMWIVGGIIALVLVVTLARKRK